MLSPGQILQGRYKIERVVGQGGMGCVCLATHLGLNSEVAIKEMTVPYSDTAGYQSIVEQFTREAKILYVLQHPNIPRVHDFFTDQNNQYLVMDYVQGQTLDEVVSRGQVTEPQLVAWAGALCSVLEYLHSQNPPIIFRDLKPSNIMLTQDGQIKLIDFGIAKSLDVRTGLGTQTSVRGAGTPGFAPPEQYGTGTNASTDIYALGATLYALLTVTLPPDSLQRVSGELELVPLRSLRPDVSPGTATVIEQMLETDRSRRPASMRAVHAALASGSTRALAAGPPRDANATVLPSFVPTGGTAIPPVESSSTIKPVSESGTTRSEPAPRRTTWLWWAGGLAAAAVAAVALLAHPQSTDTPVATVSGPASPVPRPTPVSSAVALASPSSAAMALVSPATSAVPASPSAPPSPAPHKTLRTPDIHPGAGIGPIKLTADLEQTKAKFKMTPLASNKSIFVTTLPEWAGLRIAAGEGKERGRIGTIMYNGDDGGDRFKTSDDVHIGSSEKHVRKQYGAPTKIVHTDSWKHGKPQQVTTLSYDALGVSFSFRQHEVFAIQVYRIGQHRGGQHGAGHHHH